MIIIVYGAICLGLLYWVIKSAVKAALKEFYMEMNAGKTVEVENDTKEIE